MRQLVFRGTISDQYFSQLFLELGTSINCMEFIDGLIV